jgi:hypothetical protein
VIKQFEPAGIFGLIVYVGGEGLGARGGLGGRLKYMLRSCWTSEPVNGRRVGTGKCHADLTSD